MDYQQTLDFLYAQLPMFQRDGASAYKNDLHNTIELCKSLGNPENQFKSIHIAGTNGKGSTAHSLASVLQEAGYKTGLYTSPHLKNFTERIKINGTEIDQDFVVSFVERILTEIHSLQPSFFELTVAMAFSYFATQKVDIAVIEVGMGGRLDSTNVITPELSIITNIGMDHQQFLGNTLEKIAGEKAGIIKHQVPVVISKTQEEIKPIFTQIAETNQAPIHFADQIWKVSHQEMTGQGRQKIALQHNETSATFELDLGGIYQRYNLPGILTAIDLLRAKNFEISPIQVKNGLQKVKENTGLKGRWQILGEKPFIIADTGHNEDGIKEILQQLDQTPHTRIHFVLGFAKDKDIQPILNLFPKNENYYFCQANIPRALPADELALTASKVGLTGTVEPNINKAIALAINNAEESDIVFIGGSTFVVAEIESL